MMNLGIKFVQSIQNWNLLSLEELKQLMAEMLYLLFYSRILSLSHKLVCVCKYCLFLSFDEWVSKKFNALRVVASKYLRFDSLVAILKGKFNSLIVNLYF